MEASQSTGWKYGTIKLQLAAIYAGDTSFNEVKWRLYQLADRVAGLLDSSSDILTPAAHRNAAHGLSTLMGIATTPVAAATGSQPFRLTVAVNSQVPFDVALVLDCILVTVQHAYHDVRIDSCVAWPGIMQTSSMAD